MATKPKAPAKKTATSKKTATTKTATKKKPVRNHKKITDKVVLAVDEAIRRHRKGKAFWATVAAIFQISRNYRGHEYEEMINSLLDEILQGVKDGGGQDGDQVQPFPPMGEKGD